MTTSLRHELVVPFALDGERVDKALAQMLPEYSRTLLAEWLKAGFITVDKRIVLPKEKVFGGALINICIDSLPDHNNALLPEDIPVEVIYEDESILVVNKPAGLVVHPGAGNRNATLVNALLHHAPQLQVLPRAGIVHRLDKDTTGLLLVAKTLAAHTNLVRQMQERTIERCYHALVYGEIVAGRRIVTMFGRDPRNRLKMAVLPQGREAITEFKVAARFAGFTLCAVKLATGRTHQIRVHMQHIGYPLVGDPLYAKNIRFPKSATTEVIAAVQAFKRQALHAESLSFAHPATQQLITCKAPIPQDLQDLLAVMAR